MFKLKFDTDNAAFDEILLGSRAEECARILRGIAGRIERGAIDGNIRDVNGNTVGKFNFN